MVDFVDSKSDIVRAIEAELQRQGISGVDVEALVTAIESLANAGSAPAAEGKRPEDLNSANDD
jgi:hypothetical protein